VLSQGPALLLALGYYLYFRAGMIVGGGPESHPLMVAASAICQAFGLPNPVAQPLALGVVIAYVLALGAALFRLRRRQPAEAIFFGMICFVVPAVSILLNPTGNLYFRYFLVALPFLYLLVARVLAKLVTGRRWLRWPVVGVVLVVMGLHQVKTLELMQWGRGGYDQAIFDMLEASDYAPLRLSSDHEFRTTVLLDFYAASYGLQNHLLYDSLQDGVTRAEWFVVHQLAWNAPPEPRFAEGAVIFDQFAFYRYYPAHGPTGIAWYVFRRSTEDAP